jgi:phage terminase large subunit
MFRSPVARPDAIGAEVNYWDHAHFVGSAAEGEMKALRDSNFQRYQHIWCGKYETLSVSKVFENIEIGRPEASLLMSAAPLYGLDFGYNDPSACVRCYFLPEIKTIYVAAEAYASGVTFDMLPEFWIPLCFAAAISCGPTAPPPAPSNCSRRGHGVKGVRKSKGSVQDGVQRMQNYRWLIDPDCENARREFHGYSFPVDSLTGLVIPKMNPIDKANHCVDACRYATTNVLSDDESDPHGGVFKFRLW